MDICDIGVGISYRRGEVRVGFRCDIEGACMELNNENLLSVKMVVFTGFGIGGCWGNESIFASYRVDKNFSDVNTTGNQI